MKEFDFIIIGGGLSGLAAHHQLIKKGYSVLQLERNAEIGGRTKTIDLQVAKADVGTQFLHQDYVRIMRLIREFKLEYNVIGPRIEFSLAEGDFLLHSKNPFSAWLAGMLSLKDQLLFIKEVLKAHGEPEAIFGDGQDDSQTAEDLGLKKLNRNLQQKLLEPYFSAFTYAAGHELSGVMFHRALRYMGTRKSLIGLKGGLCTLPRALAQGKEIQTNVTVTKVENKKLETNQGNFYAKKIIIATTATEAKKLLGNRFPEQLRTKYSPSQHDAILTKRNKQMTACYATILGRQKNPSFNVMTRERYKADKLVSDEYELYGLLASRQGAEQKAAFDPTLLQLKPTQVLQTHRTEWQEAIPLFSPGKLKSILDYRSQLNVTADIFLAGDYLGSPCAEGAVESGEFVASLFPAK